MVPIDILPSKFGYYDCKPWADERAGNYAERRFERVIVLMQMASPTCSEAKTRAKQPGAKLSRSTRSVNLNKAGPAREIYLTDPGEVPDPKDWKTQLVWPISE